MAFSIPHNLINRLLPRASNADPNDWTELVKRADQLVMDRPRDYGSCTRDNSRADEYEGTWMNKWVADGFAQRLHPKEVALVPLFHALTRPLADIDIAKSGWAFPPVRWDAIDGEHEGVSLKALAKRIAATSLEALDGDDSLVAIEALADAHEAHTPKELEAIKAILNRYFGRTVTFPAAADVRTGVTATFEAKETPYDLCKEAGTKATYKFKRELQSMTIKAPPDSRVSLVPLDKNGRWAERAFEADIGANGEVTFDLSRLGPDTAKFALYVVHDEDGAGPNMPVVKARMAIPMPWPKFHWTIDNAERAGRLKAGRAP